MELQLSRDYFGKAEGGKEGYTLGALYLADARLGYTVEDEDRHLEVDPSGKVYGRTCIPRGRYKVIVDYSQHFNKILPHILDVPGFDGIRIHGGNRAEDSLGCVILGQVRTEDGVAKCAGAIDRLIQLLSVAEDRGETCWITVS